MKTLESCSVTQLEELDHDLGAVRKGLRGVGVPSKLISGISTRALRSGRRQTGEFQSNRDPRWKLKANDPQYGTEEDCKAIELRLLGMMCEFVNAPVPDNTVQGILAKYISHMPVPGNYRDALTLERLDYNDFLEEATSPTWGHSKFHIGHIDPKQVPKHTPGNIGWRTMRSNLIQGDMTLREARTKFVELIGRYFDLGEVTIHPDEIALYRLI
jgi:hypothetical protein